MTVFLGGRIIFVMRSLKCSFIVACAYVLTMLVLPTVAAAQFPGGNGEIAVQYGWPRLIKFVDSDTGSVARPDLDAWDGRAALNYSPDGEHFTYSHLWDPPDSPSTWGVYGIYATYLDHDTTTLPSTTSGPSFPEWIDDYASPVFLFGEDRIAWLRQGPHQRYPSDPELPLDYVDYAWSIWSSSPDASGHRKITEIHPRAYRPESPRSLVASPDGQTIYLALKDEDPGPSDPEPRTVRVWAIDVATGDWTLVFTPDWQDVSPHFALSDISVDGKKLLYSRPTGIYTYDLQDQTQELVRAWGPGEGISNEPNLLRYSPDGRYIAYLTSGGSDAGKLRRIDVDGANLRTIRDFGQVQGYWIAWRSKGAVRFEWERRAGAGAGELSFTNRSVASDGSGEVLTPISWDFGDGSDLHESMAQQVNHTYAEPGTYDVTLTVLDQDENGNTVERSGTQQVVVEAPDLTMGLTWDEEIEGEGRLPEDATFPATLSVSAKDGLGTVENITFDEDELLRVTPPTALSISSEVDPTEPFAVEAGETVEIPVEITTNELGRVTLRSGVTGSTTDDQEVTASLEKNERIGFDFNIDVTAEVRSTEEGQEDTFVPFPQEGIELEFDEDAGTPKPRDTRLTLSIENISGDVADEAKLDLSTLVQALEDRDPNAPEAMVITGYTIEEEDHVPVDPVVSKADQILLGRIEVDETLTVVVDAQAQNKGVVESKALVIARGLAAEPPHEETRTLTGLGTADVRIDQPVLLVVDGDPESPGPIGLQRAGEKPWEFIGVVRNVSPDEPVDLTVLTEATGNVIGQPLRELLVDAGNPFGTRKEIQPGERLTLYGKYWHHGGGGSHGTVKMHLYGRVQDENDPTTMREVAPSEIVVREFGVDGFPATQRQVRIDLSDPVPAQVDWTYGELGWTFTENFTIGAVTWLQSTVEAVQGLDMSQRASTALWYVTTMMWEGRTAEEYDRIVAELSGYYEAVMGVDPIEATNAVEAAIQNQIIDVTNHWDQGDVPYFVGATGTLLGQYVPDVVTEGMIARAAALKYMEYNGKSLFSRRDAELTATLPARLAAKGRKGFEAGDLVTLEQAYRHWGMDAAQDARIRRYAQEKKVVLAMRDRSPGSVEKLRRGLLGKIESVKSKNVNHLDLDLGFTKAHLDTAMYKEMKDWSYYRDRLPASKKSNEDYVRQLKARWEERVKEYKKESVKNAAFEAAGTIPTPPREYGMNIVDNGYPELKDVPWEQKPFQLGRSNDPASGLAATDDGTVAFQPRVMHTGFIESENRVVTSFRAFTGDMDLIAITDVNGNLLSKERRTEVYRELAEIGFEHPESLTWDNVDGRAKYVADYDVQKEGSDVLLGYGPDGLRRAIKLDSRKYVQSVDPAEAAKNFVLLHGATLDWSGQPPTANPGSHPDNIPETVAAVHANTPIVDDSNIYVGPGDADYDASPDAPLLRQKNGGGYERFDPATKTWVPYSPPPGQSVKQLPQSSLTSNLSPGTSRIPIIEFDGLGLSNTVAQDWFEPGQTVIVNPGGSNEEIHTVQALGSIITARPLEHEHYAGELIAVLPGSIKAPPPSPQPPAPQPPAADPEPERQAPSIKLGGKRVEVNRARTGVLATVACPKPGTACRIVVARSGWHRVGRKRFRYRVIAPKRVSPGRSASVRIRLAPAAVRLLKRRTTPVTVMLRVRNGVATTSRRIRAVAALERATVQRRSAYLRVPRSGRVAIGFVRCPAGAGTCSVAVGRGAFIRIRGARVRVAIAGPRSIRAGRRASVQALLPRHAWGRLPRGTRGAPVLRVNVIARNEGGVLRRRLVTRLRR